MTPFIRTTERENKKRIERNCSSHRHVIRRVRKKTEILSEILTPETISSTIRTRARTGHKRSRTVEHWSTLSNTHGLQKTATARRLRQKKPARRHPVQPIRRNKKKPPYKNDARVKRYFFKNIFLARVTYFLGALSQQNASFVSLSVFYVGGPYKAGKYDTARQIRKAPRTE